MHLDMHRAKRCGARTRSGKPCRSPAMANGRCRMHGGPSPGAPKGNHQAYKHGRCTGEELHVELRFQHYSALLALWQAPKQLQREIRREGNVQSYEIGLVDPVPDVPSLLALS